MTWKQNTTGNKENLSVTVPLNKSGISIILNAKKSHHLPSKASLLPHGWSPWYSFFGSSFAWSAWWGRKNYKKKMKKKMKLKPTRREWLAGPSIMRGRVQTVNFKVKNQVKGMKNLQAHKVAWYAIRGIQTHKHLVLMLFIMSALIEEEEEKGILIVLNAWRPFDAGEKTSRRWGGDFSDQRKLKFILSLN